MNSTKVTYAVVAALLVIVVAAVLLLVTGWNPFLVWLGAAGLVTFGMYGYDKTQAKLGGWRVPEVVLHGLALAGGFWGGWLGRWVFRHKTQKPEFTVVLVVSTILYVGLAIYLFLLR
jgi:uncharacterized membrane protein YsdA (DUF1294 family)